MINRHLLRIKVLQIAYAYYTKSCTIEAIVKELDKSLNMTKVLYAKLLLLTTELRSIAEHKLENQEENTTVSDSEIAKLRRIVSNRFFQFVAEDEALQDFCISRKISWNTQDDFLINLYNSLMNSELIKEYMCAEAGLTADKIFAEAFFVKCLADSEMVAEELELQNLYWNDDFVFALSTLQRAVKQTKEDSISVFLPELFKNKDDKLFAESLLLKIIRLEERNKSLIESVTPNWEYERITLIDRLLMSMAITELLDFETIPVKVTLNEYVEISKYYSTENSSVFINGVLDKIAKKENAHKLKKGIGLL